MEGMTETSMVLELESKHEKLAQGQVLLVLSFCVLFCILPPHGYIPVNSSGPNVKEKYSESAVQIMRNRKTLQIGKKLQFWP